MIDQVPPEDAEAEPSLTGPIGFEASEGLAGFLLEHRCALALTTYRAGFLAFFGVHEGAVTVFQRAVPRPLGIGMTPFGFWLATRPVMWWFERHPPPAGSARDAIFAPLRCHVTGHVDIHDIVVARRDDPLFVVTTWNCLARLDDWHNFRPVWRPPFVSRSVGEDRCHLNGVAWDGTEARYVTVVGCTDEKAGWREVRSGGGALLSVPAGEPLVTGLSMPHSPRLHAGALWLLDSGSGWLHRLDPEGGEPERVVLCPGYARGLAFVDRYALVGVSTTRDERHFQGLPLEDALAARGIEPWCGVLVVDLDRGEVVHTLALPDERVREVYDLAVINDSVLPYAVGFQGRELERRVWPAPA